MGLYKDFCLKDAISVWVSYCKEQNTLNEKSIYSCNLSEYNLACSESERRVKQNVPPLLKKKNNLQTS